MYKCFVMVSGACWSGVCVWCFVMLVITEPIKQELKGMICICAPPSTQCSPDDHSFMLIVQAMFHLCMMVLVQLLWQ